MGGGERDGKQADGGVRVKDRSCVLTFGFDLMRGQNFQTRTRGSRGKTMEYGVEFLSFRKGICALIEKKELGVML